MKRRTGFTLIELITVLAISAILLTLIAIPVVQGFNITRAAQAFADGQDRARQVMARIEREVGNAASVRDNTGLAGTVNVRVPGLAANTQEVVSLPFSKLDFYKPAEGDPSAFVVTGGGRRAYIDPDTGKADPTLRAPKGQVNLPATVGLTLVRYWVGLRNPFANYNNPYDGLLMQRRAGADNLFVLYRAEVQPYVLDPVSGRYVVNANLFFDQDFDSDPATAGPLLDDPSFFLDNGNMGGTYAGTPPGWGEPGVPAVGGPTKAQMVRNWLKVSTVVTEISRFDMIAPIYDRRTRRVSYVGNAPQLVSLIQFQPTAVTNEPAEAVLAVRTGEETANADKVGPDAFRTDYGAWANLRLQVLPSQLPVSYGRGAGLTLAGDVRPTYDPLGTAPRVLGGLRVANNTETFSLSLNTGEEIFDVSEYLRARLSRPQSAFTQGVQAAQNRSGFLSNPIAVRNFMAMVPDPRAGQIQASFDIREVSQPTSLAVTFDRNLPAVATGQPFTPDTEPSAASWDAVAGVNTRFNRLWATWGSLTTALNREQYAKRFLDLRQVNQPDGSLSPLNPSLGLERVSIVPGSEIVIGPDQRPGPNFGQPVRYTRVSQRPVGANQYLINYVNQREPDWVALGFSAASPNLYNPMSYTATDFLSAVLQAQYRVGYVELNSNKNEPIPNGNIFVQYRFQFTEPNDVVAVDYDTTENIQVVLSIRNYPQSTNPEPQITTVVGSARVRNFIR